jgi:hypothetical protein
VHPPRRIPSIVIFFDQIRRNFNFIATREFMKKGKGEGGKVKTSPLVGEIIQYFMRKVKTSDRCSNVCNGLRLRRNSKVDSSTYENKVLHKLTTELLNNCLYNCQNGSNVIQVISLLIKQSHFLRELKKLPYFSCCHASIYGYFCLSR